jgi:nucleoid-associated protein YgaU
VVAAYLTSVVLIGALARAVPLARSARWAVDRWTPRAVRSVLDAAFGLGVAVGALTFAVTPPVPATAGSVTAVALATTTAGDPPAPTLRRVVEPQDQTNQTDPRTPIPSAPSPPRPRADGPAVADARTWTVRRGEHFWAIAEQVVAARAPQRAPTERDVARYWVRLVAANRTRLPVRENPDLLFPGTVIVLP